MPQYRLVNRGMSLERVQVHLLVGVGAPPARSAGWCCVCHSVLHISGSCAGCLAGSSGAALALFILGGLQGLVGWWMVQSGLEAARLGRARAPGDPPGPGADSVRRADLDRSGGVGRTGGPGRPPGRLDAGWPRVPRRRRFLQCLLGALVAGNQAGLIDNDWPMMSRAFVPTDYWRGGLWATFVHGAQRRAVQSPPGRLCLRRLRLGHRRLGRSFAASGLPDPQVGTVAAGVVALVQVLLGIVTSCCRSSPCPWRLMHQVDGGAARRDGGDPGWRSPARLTVACYHIGILASIFRVTCTGLWRFARVCLTLAMPRPYLRPLNAAWDFSPPP